MGGGVESPQGADTPPPRGGRGAQGGQNPRRPHSGSGQTGGGRTGAGGRGRKPTHRPRNQDAGSQRRRRQANGWTADGGVSQHDRDGGGRRQSGAPAAAIRRRRQRQVQKRRACASRVRPTGVGGGGGGSIQRRGLRGRGRPWVLGETKREQRRRRRGTKPMGPWQNREGTETEEEEKETPQRALPTRESDGGETNYLDPLRSEERRGSR